MPGPHSTWTKLYKGYSLSMPEREKRKNMSHVPLPYYLLMSDERSSMNSTLLADQGIPTVDTIDKEKAKVVRNCVRHQHRDQA